RAETVEGLPERGVLRRVSNNEPGLDRYYTVGPQTGDQNGQNPLQTLSPDSVELVKDAGGEQYFRLNEDEYWYDLVSDLHDGSVMDIPLVVAVHTVKEKNTVTNTGESNGLLMAKFTLLLSYR
ncbi:hypothetical protein, partial [Enterobacter ludwigii]|uniref:hypothetical protein n=1 Tax=Enterobacter ludwigii TaxID=299767 RepID=UPI003F6FF77C